MRDKHLLGCLKLAPMRALCASARHTQAHILQTFFDKQTNDLKLLKPIAKPSAVLCPTKNIRFSPVAYLSPKRWGDQTFAKKFNVLYEGILATYISEQILYECIFYTNAVDVVQIESLASASRIKIYLFQNGSRASARKF